jgi:cation diffusion facilitator family transporter
MTNLLIKSFIKNPENTGDERVRAKYGGLASVTGIILNALLFLAKLALGLLTASMAIMADAFNNIADAGSSLVTMLGFRLAAKPVDKEHPLGHGRFEYIAGFLVDMAILLVGGELLLSSVERIFTPASVQTETVTFFILGAAILVKLWLFFFYRKIGKKINSAALNAAALDSVSDCIATTLVLLTAVAVKLGLPENIPLDSIIGVIVAGFIIFSGVKAAKETIDLLLGSPPDPEFVKQIYEFVEKYPEVTGIHDVIVHDYGPGRKIVSFHAEVPDDCNINYAHEVIDCIERDMFEHFKCVVTIHLDPLATKDEQVQKRKDFALECAKAVDERLSIHDFRMTQGETFVNLIFDLVVPTDCPLSVEETVKKVTEEVGKRDENCFAVIKGEHPFV